jgi:hypothetical protein
MRRGASSMSRIRPWIGVLLISATGVVLWIVLSHQKTGVRFDSATWKGAEGIRDPVRLMMVDDLLSRYKIVGMSRNEIDQLLGVPTPTMYFKDYDYVYWLGPERSYISVDSEWLGIRFENNIAVEARLLKD